LIRQSPEISEENEDDEFSVLSVSVEDNLGSQQPTNVFFSKDITCVHKHCSSDPKKDFFYRKKTNKRSKPIFYCRSHRLQNTADFFDDDPVVVIDKKR
jgi:hypothetical protein